MLIFLVYIGIQCRGELRSSVYFPQAHLIQNVGVALGRLAVLSINPPCAVHYVWENCVLPQCHPPVFLVEVCS
jgi:hypothetical protein